MKTILTFIVFPIVFGFNPVQSQGMGTTGKKAQSIDIESILKSGDNIKIVTTIDDYLTMISQYGEKLDKLTEHQKNFLFITNLEKEINNGGFNQFYFNSSGNHSHETVDALLAIGANKTSEIVKKANLQFPDNTVPKNRDERIKILFEIEEDANAIWNECDAAFYKYEDNLAELLVKYVKENRESFK